MLNCQLEMSLISKLFGRAEAKAEPNIKFGRYSDSYKSEDKYESWDKSIEAFEAKNYKAAYAHFFDYLRDEQTNNVLIKDGADGIDFELFQGSKKIVGSFLKDRVVAEAKIAVSNENEIGALRKLIEMNFNLKYCRYALDREENITIVFNSYFMDCSPYKLYYALKEISTHADKQDDILMSEFETLREINTGHIRRIGDAEIKAKFDFLNRKIQDVLESFRNGSLDKVNFPGGKSFELLDTVYKLDYLLKPEGITMQSFESIHREFFKKNNVSPHAKNQSIVAELEKVLEIQYSDFKDEIYEVLSTFGVTAPTSYEQYKNFAEGELSNYKWYEENKYRTVAEAIPSYIIGYSLFNYSMPKPLTQLLQLYYQVTEQAFFNELGFDFKYVENSKISKSKIKAGFKKIVQENKSLYPKFNPNTNGIEFDSFSKFGYSFVMMTTKLDLNKAKN